MDSLSFKTSPTNDIHPSRPKCEFFLPHKREAIREALDHLFVSQMYHKLGKIDLKPLEESGGLCGACESFTSHKCQGCNKYVCSSDCLHPVWKVHEEKCRKLPPSEPKSPTTNNDNEANGKLMLNKNSSPFGKLTQQFKNSPNQQSNQQPTTSKAHGRKSEPAMGKSSTKYRHNNGQRSYQKRLSLDEDDSRPREKRWFGRNNRNKASQGGSSSSAETESVSNSFSSKTSRPDAKTKEPYLEINDGVMIKRSKPKKVVFFYKEPDSAIYWVMEESDLSEFEAILNALGKECDEYETVQPEVGLICGCKYSDEWYRARVISLLPKCQVHYIDYGNTAEVDASCLKALPPEIRMVKNLVYRIEFDESVPEQYKKKDLSGKVLEVEKKLVNKFGVEVVNVVSDSSELENSETEAAANETTQQEISSAKKLTESSMSFIKSDSKGLISFLPEGVKMRYGLNIPEGSEEETEMDVKETEDLVETDLIPGKAVEGDYVLVIDYDDQRRRGKVMSILCSTYYVLLIDYGIVVMVENVYQLPGRRANLIHLGANVIINEILSCEKVRNLEKCLYQVIGEQDSKGKWPCELKETSSKEVIAKGYIQSPPEEGVTIPLFMPIESGSTCEMSIVTGVKKCYVRPLNEEAARKSLEMSVKMAEFLVKAEPLTQPPEIGKMYAAKNKKDDCCHRAVIKSLKNDTYEVLFVDYGTVENVRMKDLKPLPVSIKVVPFFATEVTLSGITVESLSESTKRYLDKLIQENLTLVLSFSDGESDEVVLKEKTSGVVVNEVIENPKNEKNSENGESEDDKVSNLNENFEVEKKNKNENGQDWGSSPRSKSSNEDESTCSTKVFKLFKTGENIMTKKNLKLPNIRVDQKYDLIIQYIDEHDFFSTLTFWMANANDKTFCQVSNVVNSKIEKYCREQGPYRPKEQEMCLALYEGDWYRGLTLKVKKDSYEIFFVDFGNTCTLKPKDIRKMNREFMANPAWAFKCIISGVGRLIGKPHLKKAVYGLLKRRMNSVLTDVLVAKYEFEIYHVTIPEIEKILVSGRFY